MNEYQREAAEALPAPVSDYAARAAEAQRRYQQLKEASASPAGAALTLGGLAFGILMVEMTLLYPTGLSVLLLATGLQALLFFPFRDRAGRDFRLLGLLLLLTAAGYPLHYTPSTRWLCSLGLLAGFALQLATLEGGSPFSSGTILSLLSRLAGEPLVHLGLPFSALGSLRSTKSRAVRAGAAILLGLALATPVGGILLLLFSAADAAFGAAMETFFRSLRLTPASLFCDLMLGGTLGLLLAARLLCARFFKREQTASEKAALFRIPTLASGAFLGCICAITLCFVGFQFAYLFGGEQTRAAWEMTYSDYARRGFFELCAASAIIFGAALLALIFTRAKENHLPHSIRALALTLCLGDFIILASALRRMLLYISVYGMSIRRILTLWGMGVIFIGLMLLVIRCIYERLPVIRLLFLTGFFALCLISLLNTERLTASWNIRQMEKGNIPFDSGFFQELSYTAAPQLEELHQAFPEKQTELEAILTQMQRQYQRRHPLYSFSLDQLQAKEVFERLLPPENLPRPEAEETGESA
ncbi:MAG: DUF4173 domain-containing protein [Provencibacterium sp.]|jgi:hypothetical protein|nr:DUF4173 domain-containing protein [Provencibacterium sp.]